LCTVALILRADAREVLRGNPQFATITPTGRPPTMFMLSGVRRLPERPECQHMFAGRVCVPFVQPNRYGVNP
jgi:hypothetical protein